MTQSSPLRFEILGPLRAWRDGQGLDLGAGKQRAVLAVLLLQSNKPVAPAAIIDAVWQNDPPENGTNVVQKYVAGLRRVLEPHRSPGTPGQLITLTDAGYVLTVGKLCLDADVAAQLVRRANAARSERRLDEAAALLREATGMWRSDALAGLGGQFFTAARERLMEGRGAALEAWAELELELGRHAHLVPGLFDLVTQFPLREGLRYLLILALYRCGRQAEALAAYRDTRTLLDEEFGVEPGERLQDLHRRILQADPGLYPTAPVTPPTPPEPVAWAPPIAVADPQPAGSTRALAAGFAARSTPAEPFALPAPAKRQSPADRAPGSHSTMLGVGGLVLPMLTCGFASWVTMAFFAVYRRSWKVGLSALGYLLLTLFFVVAFGTTEEVDSVPENLSIAGMMVTVLGGALQGALLGFGVPQVQPDAAVLQQVAVQARRDQARLLLDSHPEIARQLKIGRPDLPRHFDDGYLIDVNAIPVEVLTALIGITAGQAYAIAEDRRHNGPLPTVDHLVLRHLLPRDQVDRLRDVLIACP